MDESLQIKTNQTFLDFHFSKTNPQTESLRIALENLESQVYKSGFVRIRGSQIRNRNSQIRTLKDLFCDTVLKICEDLFRFVKTG